MGSVNQKGEINIGDTILIRKLSTLPELTVLQELEMTVWQTDVAIPLHQTLTVVKNGGIVLGAFADENMVGFLYSFPGYLNNQVYLCSHMLGIRPGWRHRGIGARLKWAQAEAARVAGYSLISWTYDPLETPNGHLNIGKLGAVCSTYIINCYGEMQDGLNQGLPSDRFQVAWWINEPRQVPFTQVAVDLISWCRVRTGRVVPVAITTTIPAEARSLSVAIPAEFQEIRGKDPSLAKAWREATRQVFTTSFASGWVVAGFRHRDDGVHEYLLCERKTLELPLEPWQEGESL